MSLLSRLARATHPVGRAYSSFFSSKPGGGRHFVSAKPPKPVLEHGRAKVDNTTGAGSPPDSSGTSPPPNASSVVKAGSGDERSPSKSGTAHPQSSTVPTLLPPFTQTCSDFDRFPRHPTVSRKEYKLHQFFSLHRPLLLLNQPTSVIFEGGDQSIRFRTTAEDQVNSDVASVDKAGESSAEAEADAARQLAHTLVMNCVGSAIAWEGTLCRLGMDVKNDMASAKEAAETWVTIHADSTRRKRRKKMKKHKLKKRRRLTRRQNK